MIYQTMKRYSGFTFVVVGAVLMTALAKGDSLAAVVIACAVVLTLGAVVLGRRDRSLGSSGASAPEARAFGEPYARSYRWKVGRHPDLEEIFQALNREDLELRLRSKSPDKVVLSGGSQFRSRLWGGYFVAPKLLPVRAELRAVDGTGGSGCAVELDVRDDFRIAIRDKALCDRLAQAVEGIRRPVEMYLEAMEGFEGDPARSGAGRPPGRGSG